MNAGEHAALPGTELVRAERLSKRFPARSGLLSGRGDVVALEDVTLSIERGGALGVVGESGCGKTTLARVLLRLVEPSAGRVVIDGIDVTALGPAALRRFRRRAQILFQDSLGALDPRFTAEQAIAEPLAWHRVVPPGARGAEVDRLLARVGLDPALASRWPHQLSGGQRQRVALARALAPRPELLVADEPLASLDASLRAHVLALLADLRRERRLTLLMISHDLAAVRQVCDRVVVMYLGRVVEEAVAPALFARPRHPYTRALLASMPPWPPEARRARPRASPPPLSGEPPAAVARPAGCPFHPRCPLFLEMGRPARCRDERPPLDPRGAPGHLAACHFAA